MSGPVSADGCPVEVYRLLPHLGEADLIDEVIGRGSLVLDLGAGTGRIAHALAARGHTVVAVDNSPDMLAEIGNVEPVLTDIETFRDGRRFDAVVLASHLINTPNRATCDALLATVAHHLHPTATAFIEWHPPTWFDALVPGSTYRGMVGAVDTTLYVNSIEDVVLDADVTYSAHGREWTQHFNARRLSHEELKEALAHVGLTAGVRLSGDWLTAHPARASTIASSGTDLEGDLG